MEFIWPVSLVTKDEQHSRMVGLSRYSVFGWNGVVLLVSLALDQGFSTSVVLTF